MAITYDDYNTHISHWHIDTLIHINTAEMPLIAEPLPLHILILHYRLLLIDIIIITPLLTHYYWYLYISWYILPLPLLLLLRHYITSLILMITLLLLLYLRWHYTIELPLKTLADILAIIINSCHYYLNSQTHTAIGHTHITEGHTH